MVEAFERYLRKLCETPLCEHGKFTGRPALEALLNEFVPGTSSGRDTVRHGPKRGTDQGAPDFMVTRQGMILGYVETKPIGENLGRVLESEQFANYRSLSENILLTDYLHFVWISRDGTRRETLCHATDLEDPKFRPRPDRAGAVAGLLEGFFSTAPEGIGCAQQLALALADRSKMLRDYLAEALVRQERLHREGRLYRLYRDFRGQVFPELTPKEFADTFAQILAYGLFLARLNSDSEPVTLRNAREYVPGSFRPIRDLIDFLAELEKPDYRDMRWMVEEVLSIVNGLEPAAIQDELSFRQLMAMGGELDASAEEEDRLFGRDPFIYFYEDYLKAYDTGTRKGRGVYYTPPPVVNFIVRAVDDILKDSFGIRDGLADHRRVSVLDFACGTGTFLVEVFQRIFENIGGPGSGRADLLVREHLLKNIYGFEYLVAPYTIAHLKLSQYLQDRKHPLKDDERLQILLTDTLEPIAPRPNNMLLSAVSAEVEATRRVKEQPALVIIGNPPYSGHSTNKGEWITAQMARYREGFPELSKPAQGKWLQDDYVKFIRFAQIKMEAVSEGVVGVITNHSWLDNPTFKGMRKSLMETFHQIYVLDLHGNSKKKERAPGGGEDRNVFDIEQGVAISLFIKGGDLEQGVWHGDLWGKRLAKYQALAGSSKESIAWARLEPETPDWLFKPQDAELARQYRQYWPIPEIFARLGDPAPGFATQHDDFAISYSRAEAIAKVRRFLSFETEDEARQEFSLCAQSQWQYGRARKELAELNLEENVQQVAYRPFDNRWTVWDRNVAVHRRLRITKHLRADNWCLIVARNWGAIGSETYDGMSVAAKPVELNYFRRGGEFVFPVYVRSESEILRVESLGSEFRAFLDAHYEHHYTPEEILGYIYAVLHAPTYRTRYAEFLRMDFPRIPFPESADDFESLSGLGWALVQAHLLREFPRRGLAAYHGKGGHEVEAVRYSPRDEAIWINKNRCFKPVPPSVREFHIGGYRVLDKYLKSRKGRTLSLDEIDHVGAIADSLAFTIEQMAAIDAAYRAAFESVHKSESPLASGAY